MQLATPGRLESQLKPITELLERSKDLAPPDYGTLEQWAQRKRLEREASMRAAAAREWIAGPSAPLLSPDLGSRSQFRRRLCCTCLRFPLGRRQPSFSRRCPLDPSPPSHKCRRGWRGAPGRDLYVRHG